MSHKFNSTSERAWLKNNHQASSNRSIDLGKKAIDALVKDHKPVTYQTISQKSKDKEIDPEMKGIHPNTIRYNPELYEYYKQHSNSFKQKKNAIRRNHTLSKSRPEVDYRRLSKGRNRDNLKNNYLKLSKKELVERLLQAEEYIAENNEKWVANHFEMFK